MSPPYLNMSDIFKIYTNYEPSSIKIWEMIRSYDPIEFAKLLYILENVTKSSRRKSIAIPMETIHRITHKQQYSNDFVSDDIKLEIDEKPPDIIIKISKIKALRLEKCVDYYSIDNESNYVNRYASCQAKTRPSSHNVNGQSINSNNIDITNANTNSIISNNQTNGNTTSLNQIENIGISYNNIPIQSATFETLHRSEPTIFWNRIQSNNFTIDATEDVDYCNNLTYISSAQYAKRQKLNNTINIPQKTKQSSALSSPPPPHTSITDISITKLMNDLRHNTNNSIPTSIYEQILNHNFGTKVYIELLSNVQYLLLNDNFQMERNAVNAMQDNQSIVVSFLQFYKNIMFEQTIDNDPRNFHFIIIPKARQLSTASLDYLRRDDPQYTNDCSSMYIHQPYFNGMHLIVYSSPSETKCFNRFGELFPNLAYALRSKVPCTFEVVVLPIDRYNNVRSWRYWQYRRYWVMYIVDVYRYKQSILLDIPFEERIKYAKYIANGNELRLIPNNMQTVDEIYKLYEKNRDIYDPIGGVYRRHRHHVLNNNRYNQQNLDSTILDRHQNSYILFNILYTFDLLHMKVLSVKNDICNIQQLNMNLEMADYRVLCIAYGHCEKYIYLCQYDRTYHQFVHAASMERLGIESDKLQYKPEKIFVMHNKILPMGVLYLRVYFDINYNVIGYDTKSTDSRFNLPYTNCLYIKNALK